MTCSEFEITFPVPELRKISPFLCTDFSIKILLNHLQITAKFNFIICQLLFLLKRQIIFVLDKSLTVHTSRQFIFLWGKHFSNISSTAVTHTVHTLQNYFRWNSRPHPEFAVPAFFRWGFQRVLQSLLLFAATLCCKCTLCNAEY
jgi:hypothetical protein